MWLVESDIANLLSVMQLASDFFIIDYKTKLDWVIKTPEGEQIVFKKDTGECKVSHFIDMGSQEALELFQYDQKLETVRVNYEGFTKNYV